MEVFWPPPPPLRPPSNQSPYPLMWTCSYWLPSGVSFLGVVSGGQADRPPVPTLTGDIWPPPPLIRAHLCDDTPDLMGTGLEQPAATTDLPVLLVQSMRLVPPTLDSHPGGRHCWFYTGGRHEPANPSHSCVDFLKTNTPVDLHWKLHYIWSDAMIPELVWCSQFLNLKPVDFLEASLNTAVVRHRCDFIVLKVPCPPPHEQRRIITVPQRRITAWTDGLRGCLRRVPGAVSSPWELCMK